ncbi:hypothetical protein JWV26_08410 [Ectopseudomonas toyotomiensis]|uniref:Uncharacterized protein n=1 Tax=Ectopseudomonas toyotomiensis TaxID=554344 RepID=A0ABD7E0X9_9GAMM|nr:hypothetical protein [Pseudomonas toyotomiensis]QSL94365.1 hypothetical protein JWV26_08410 [Pseudomonas toyotomiensis]
MSYLAKADAYLFTPANSSEQAPPSGDRKKAVEIISYAARQNVVALLWCDLTTFMVAFQHLSDIRMQLKIGVTYTSQAREIGGVRANAWQVDGRKGMAAFLPYFYVTALSSAADDQRSCSIGKGHHPCAS